MLIFKGLNLSKTFQSVLKGVVLSLLCLSCFFFVLFFFPFAVAFKLEKGGERQKF